MKSKKTGLVNFREIVNESSLILESINDAVLLLDGLNFIDCNQKAIELLGFEEKAELIGLSVTVVSPEFQSDGVTSKAGAKKWIKSALKGNPQLFDWVHIKTDGQIIETEVSLKNLEFKGKKYVVALVRDISEKKKSERINDILFKIADATGRMKSSKELYILIREQINSLMDTENFYIALIEDKAKSLYSIPYIIDENPKETTFTEKIINLAGGFTDYIVKNEIPLLANEKRIKDLFANNKVKNIGTPPKSWMGVPLRSEHEGIIGVLAIQNYSDPQAYTEKDKELLMTISPTITSMIIQKRTEDLVKASEEKFKQLFDNIPDAIFISYYGGKNSGMIIDANPAAEKQTGYLIDELKGMNIGKDLQADWYEEALVDERETNLNEVNFVRFREKKCRRDGSHYWTDVIVTKTEINGEMVSIGVNRDITAQIEVENALTESESKFRTVIEEAAEIVFTTDNRGFLTYVNPAGLASSGYSAEELKTMKYIDLVKPEYQYLVKSNYFRQYLKKESLSSGEYPFITKKGEKRWYQLNVRLILENNEVDGFYIIARDITERKAAETALEESEEKFRNFIENAGVGFGSDDQEGNITYFNKKFADLFGYSVEEIKNKNHSSLVHPDDREKILELHNQRMKGGNPPQEYEVRGIKKDGSTIFLEIAVDRLIESDGGIAGTQNFFRDITDKKRAEEELLKLKKTLEKKVEEKTADLKEKISDLQRFHDATIEREFRIKDLNDIIDELKAKLALKQ